jgi:hypothetical protein
MPGRWIIVVACLLFDAITARATQAADVIVGVNVRGWGGVSEAQQDVLIEQLQKDGVKTIREALPNNLDDKFAHFITSAHQHGIGLVAILYPTQGGTQQHTSAVDPSVGRMWRVPALSDADPEGFRKWFAPQLAAMEAARIRMTAFELGNEFNMTGYNADLPAPGSGRVLGLSDLNNPNDPKARNVANGYRAYIKILAVLKDMRDHSQINKTTPIISGGLGNVGLPQRRSFNKQVATSVPDTIEFLRSNGSDRLVDGYGVHVYPNGDLHQPVSARIAVLNDNFSACRRDSKPCWLTEWAFNNRDQSCPIKDETRVQLVGAERSAFKSFTEQGRLAAIIYYSWNGDFVGQKENMGAIFRCGSLTDAGKLALSPM